MKHKMENGGRSLWDPAPMADGMIPRREKTVADIFEIWGRETFLFPMKWERGWPVFCPDTGKVEVSYPCPDLPIFSVETQEGCIHFREEDTLGLCFNFLRTPKEKWYMLDQENGLQLLARPERIDERVNPSFIGRRQEHMDFTVTAYLKFPMCTEYEEAGLVLFHNRFSYITFLLGRTKGRNRIRVIHSFYGKETVEGNVFVEGNEGKLRISAVGQSVSFFYKEKGKMEIPVAEHVDSSKLNSDYTHSHTGTYIGMYVTSNGIKGKSRATYEYFSYNGK